MITQEHLEHWIREIEYQLNGITNEVDPDKVEISGLKLPNEKYVSFEYIQEKASRIKGNIRMIKEDIVNE